MNKVYALKWAEQKAFSYIVIAPSANAARRLVAEWNKNHLWLDINESYVNIIGQATGVYANTVDPKIIMGV